MLFGASSMLGYSLFRARPEVAAYCNGKTRQSPTGHRGMHRPRRRARRRSQLFATCGPELIVQCAGVCDVENCETSPEFAWRVNVEAMRILLAHAPAQCRIVYCSSDHVFSGDTGPYDEDSPTDPLSVYGQTRVAAEQVDARAAEHTRRSQRSVDRTFGDRSQRAPRLVALSPLERAYR